jgi:cytochrome P450
LSFFKGPNSILTADGVDWRLKHKLMFPIFHQTNMEKHFFPVIVNSTHLFIQKLQDRVRGDDKNELFPMSSLNIDEMTSPLTLDIIAQTVFSKDYKIQEKGTEGKIS